MNSFRIEFDDGVYVDAQGDTFAQAARQAQKDRVANGIGYGDVTNTPAPIASRPARKQSLLTRVFARFAV
jgi:hypothetical protein